MTFEVSVLPFSSDSSMTPLRHHVHRFGGGEGVFLMFLPPVIEGKSFPDVLQLLRICTETKKCKSAVADFVRRHSEVREDFSDCFGVDSTVRGNVTLTAPVHPLPQQTPEQRTTVIAERQDFKVVDPELDWHMSELHRAL
ncbi:hypothetical protein F7725_023649 [Dissostichus mawsoni]|uniref:Uncharacterized protein n=1 Tax=Dissostichus mawsoni TaxID=36200 RepID=A0A7J5Y004_DISMA|nr:hypothetical protein F7725_023649 [Dissostichus mawsoni]